MRPRYSRPAVGSLRDVFRYLAVAALAGASVGAVSTDTGRTVVMAVIREIAGAERPRARQPQPGDYWQGCDDARAAGAAPIYAGEPGYREQMDGDHDGIACETHR